MIGFLSGKIIDIFGSKILLRTPSGVGYFIETSPVAPLMINDQVELYILEVIKDSTHELYGFVTKEDRMFIDKLLKVSGIGPKMAANIIYTLGVHTINKLIFQGDHKALADNVKGLGEKTAKKIILELKGTLVEDVVEGEYNSQIALDFTEALNNLGYKRGDIVSTITKLKKSGDWDDRDISYTIRAGLRLLSKK